MDIKNQSYGKVISAAYQHYITLTEVEDKYKPIFTTITVPSWEGLDQFAEIDEAEAERIRTVKNAAKGNVEYPEEQVNQMIGLFATFINTMSLADEQALQFKNIYPKWETFINKQLEQGYKVLYQDKLYKVKQTISTVLENQPPSIDTAALYEEINPTVEEGGHAGTLEVPIPYNNNMELFEGKYYSQNGVTYKCTRNTEQAVYQDLSDLVGIYVEQAS
jgi:hypothetical protein